MSSETPSTNVIKAYTSCFTWIPYIWRGLKSNTMVSERTDVTQKVLRGLTKRQVVTDIFSFIKTQIPEPLRPPSQQVL